MFWPEFNNINLEGLCFQLEGPNFRNKPFQLLIKNNNRRDIEKSGYINWPPRSPDFAIVGLFSLGFSINTNIEI